MATTYLSPGVYVEEVPSAVQSIAGVGTSTAGFIGVVPDTLTIPFRNPDFDPTKDPTPLPAPAAKPTTPTPDPNALAPDPNAPAVTPAAASPNPMYRLPDKPFAVKPAGEAFLCTTFTEFTSAFGGFSTHAGQAALAHAVYGFFAVPIQGVRVRRA